MVGLRTVTYTKKLNVPHRGYAEINSVSHVEVGMEEKIFICTQSELLFALYSVNDFFIFKSFVKSTLEYISLSI